MKRSKKVTFQLLICFGLYIVTTLSFAQNIKDVIVANPDSQPVPFMNVDNPARNPYQETKSRNCDLGAWTCEVNFLTVPAGYRLVVTDISCLSVQHPDVSVAQGILTDITNVYDIPQTFFAFSKTGYDPPTALSFFVGATRTTHYYEPGKTPQLFIRLTNAASAAYPGNLNCTLAGYYIQLP